MKQLFSLTGLKRTGKGLQSSLCFGNLDVHGITPVKPVSGGDATNKAGRLVFKGQSAAGAVKIYEAASGKHASFIDCISAMPSLSGLFPATLSRQGNFLVAEWVIGKNEGRRAPLPSPAILADLLARIHKTPGTSVPVSGFDYWHDLIRPRFLRAADFLGKARAGENIVSAVDAAWSRTPVLMHPDVTPINLVQDLQGRWRIIDNELLTVGGLPLLDICNAARSLPAAQRQELFDLYLSKTGTTLYAEEVSVLEAAWLARNAGAAFIGGDVGLPFSLFEKYEQGESILPFKIVNVRPNDSGHTSARMVSPLSQARSI